MRFFKRRQKYGAKRCRCYQGHEHPSKLEAGYCDQLAFLKSKGDIFDYEVEVTVDLKINGILICRHKPDFKIWRTRQDKETGRFEFHETKGMPTPAWRLKMKIFKALFPDVLYVVVR